MSEKVNEVNAGRASGERSGGEAKCVFAQVNGGVVDKVNGVNGRYDLLRAHAHTRLAVRTRMRFRRSPFTSVHLHLFGYCPAERT